MVVLLLSTSLYASSRVVEKMGAAETGVTSYTHNVHGGKAKEATIFSLYNPGATVVYNSAGGTAATDGWISLVDFSDGAVFHVDLDTLDSTGLDFVVEGLISDDTSTPILVFTKSFADINTGYYIPVCACDGLKYIRCSIQATGTPSTDSITVKFRAEGAK